MSGEIIAFICIIIVFLLIAKWVMYQIDQGDKLYEEERRKKMSRKREFMVWLYLKKGVTYKRVKNWKEAVRYAKKSLKRDDVTNIAIDVRKI